MYVGDEVCLKLKYLAQDMLPWFTEKFMYANPSKFNFMFFFYNKTTHLYDITISESVTLEYVKCAKI